MRFIQSEVSTKKGKHPCSGYFKLILIVSVDNIDFFAQLCKTIHSEYLYVYKPGTIRPLLIMNGQS